MPPDATLQAAAPEMYKALLAARAWVQHWNIDKGHGLMPTDGSLADALETIEAALSKARGA